MTDLKKLAEQWASEYKPGDNMVEQITSLLERVQKEALASRIELPTYDQLIDFCVNNQATLREAFHWLRDNVRYVTKTEKDERIEVVCTPKQHIVGDEELKRTAFAYACSIDGRHLDQDAFIAGYRAAEKKARGE